MDRLIVETTCPSGPQRRRSPRFGSPRPPLESDNKMALGVKRSITVKKIAPRKTTVPSEQNKENTLVRLDQNKENTLVRLEQNQENKPGRPEQKKPKVSTPETVPPRRSRSLAGKQRAAMPSPIVPSTPPVSPRTQQPAADPQDTVWSQKVRRSYSRLNESVHSPESRDTLFGFERLKTPEIVRRAEQSGSQVSGSFTSLLEAEECCTEPDPNIPGVAVVKERRRRKKVQQIDAGELDALAAQMNAEFREAEQFELVVE